LSLVHALTHLQEMLRTITKHATVAKYDITFETNGKVASDTAHFIGSRSISRFCQKETYQILWSVSPLVLFHQSVI